MIRCSSPYLTDEEKHKKEFLESKKQWTNKQQDFNRVFSKYDGTNFIPNYVNLTSSPPISDMKYRTLDRNKWVNPNKDFIVHQANKEMFM